MANAVFERIFSNSDESLRVIVFAVAFFKRQFIIPSFTQHHCNK